MADELGAWKPISVEQAGVLFSSFGAPWWVAGGVALELFAGSPIRTHRDLDLLVLRRDRWRIQRVLASWDLHAAVPGKGLCAWPVGQALDPQINNLWCRSHPDAPWSLEVLLDDADDDAWVSRRCAPIRRPLCSLGWMYGDSVPVLAPEIQLFYKAKNARPVDDQDFAATLPHMSAEQRTWLDRALTRVEPQHQWRSRLS